MRVRFQAGRSARERRSDRDGGTGAWAAFDVLQPVWRLDALALWRLRLGLRRPLPIA